MKIVGIVGRSGSGKTQLIGQLIPLLRQRGLRVSTVKHAHQGFDMDRPGKDSWVHRQAGAEEVLVVSPGRWALLREEAAESSLTDLMRRMAPVDILLVEGFKTMPIARIEVYRPALGKAPLFPDEPGIVAVASDAPCAGPHPLDLGRPEEIVSFLLSLPESEWP